MAIPVEEILAMLSNYAFPIVACVYLARTQSTLLKEFTQTVGSLEASLKSMHNRHDELCEDIKVITTKIDQGLGGA